MTQSEGDRFRQFTERVKKNPDRYPEWVVRSFEDRLAAIKAGYPDEPRLLADSPSEGRGAQTRESECGPAPNRHDRER